MKRILFVDDEPHLLEGLENLLRKQRRDWDMVFSVGAPAAVEELAKGPFDVVVSDMEMPGAGGAGLLERVKDEYPGVVRIVLSGSASRDAVIRAVPVAHQYLSKPCDVESLREAIERTCSLQNLLSDESIRRVIGKLDKLPSVPQTYWDLTDAAGRPDVGLADLARIVERDPAMCVKVLQLANSAFFGATRRTSSIHQAVGYLGADLLKALALTAGLFGTMKTGSSLGGFLDDLQKSSVATARLAKRFLKDPRAADEAFTASMIRDVGKVVVAVAREDVFNEAQKAARAGRAPYVTEREALGVTHAEIGGYLLGVWGLPFSIVEAVAFHHEPSRVPVVGNRAVLAAVHAADAMADLTCGSLDEDFLNSAGVGDIAQWRLIAEEQLRATAA